MELALALTLRVYHVVPDAVLAQIVGHRSSLYRHYRRAYAERQTGIGTPISVQIPGSTLIHMRGAFLDLQINFSGGKLTSFGPPKLMTPSKALRIFTEGDVAARAFLPINLSLLAERVVSMALQVPPIRRGPRATVKKRRKKRLTGEVDQAAANLH
jgi:hypothetical protein